MLAVPLVAVVVLDEGGVVSVNEDFDFDQGCPFFIFLSRAFFKIMVSFLRLKFSTLLMSTNFFDVGGTF